MKNELTIYESSALKKIQEWKDQKPGVITSITSTILKPVSWLAEQIIPQKAIEGALIAMDKVAEILTDKTDVLRDGGVTSIKELQKKDLCTSDELANSVHNWALGIAFAEGGATGTTGAVGLVVDIPTLITLALRTIHKIGVCYGFECKTKEDQQFILGIMSVAGANSMKEKCVALATLQSMKMIIVRTSWKKMAEKATMETMSKEAALIAVRNLAKQLSINLSKRKAAQIIPIIGAGVGASMNAAFINDIAWAARHCFQERWLQINSKIELK